MKAWKAHCGDDWAILVIAPNRREAMRQAFKGITGLISDIPYIDIRVKQMKKNLEWLLGDADKEKLERSEAHFNDSPRSCEKCYMWGMPLNDDGICKDCEQGNHDDSVGN